MDQPARCIRYLYPDVVLNNVTGRKVNNYIRKHCSEYYQVPPGIYFRGIGIQLKSPMLTGFRPESGTILMPFTKPCYGTMLLEIKAEKGDFAFIRAALGEKNPVEAGVGRKSEKRIRTGGSQPGIRSGVPGK